MTHQNQNPNSHPQVQDASLHQHIENIVSQLKKRRAEQRSQAKLLNQNPNRFSIVNIPEPQVPDTNDFAEVLKNSVLLAVYIKNLLQRSYNLLCENRKVKDVNVILWNNNLMNQINNEIGVKNNRLREVVDNMLYSGNQTLNGNSLLLGNRMLLRKNMVYVQTNQEILRCEKQALSGSYNSNIINKVNHDMIYANVKCLNENNCFLQQNLEIVMKNCTTVYNLVVPPPLQQQQLQQHQDQQLGQSEPRQRVKKEKQCQLPLVQPPTLQMHHQENLIEIQQQHYQQQQQPYQYNIQQQNYQHQLQQHQAQQHQLQQQQQQQQQHMLNRHYQQHQGQSYRPQNNDQHHLQQQQHYQYQQQKLQENNNLQQSRSYFKSYYREHHENFMMQQQQLRNKNQEQGENYMHNQEMNYQQQQQMSHPNLQPQFYPNLQQGHF